VLVNSTVAVSVIATVFSVPVTVAVPADVDDVNVAEYMPSPLSTTAPSVPMSVASATASPPAVRLLPFASFTCTTTLDVDAPSATMLVGDAVIVDVAADAVPGVNSTVAVSVIATPLSVPVTVAVPAVVDDVNVAEYVPSPLSVTAPSVPASVASATVSPPAVRLLPFASFSCTVTADVDAPSATMLVGDAVIVDVAADPAPGVNSTVAVSVIATPLSVPVTVAVPAVVDDVNVAEYVPLPLSVTALSSPASVASATASPPTVRLLP
jgi:hypothetical protein